MDRALFLSLPLTGHINPSLGLVHELVRRGDEVVYYATASYKAAVEATGSRFRPYRNAFLSDLREVPERLHELSWLLTRTVGEILDDELEDFRAARPDYLITDSVAPMGAMGRGKAGHSRGDLQQHVRRHRHVLRYATGRAPVPTLRVASRRSCGT
jgi:UDP:flavonoid glycosyltransferase YjiC (YdhE family)